MIKRILLKILGQKKIENLVVKFSRWVGIDLISIGYKNNGILNYQNSVVTGEHRFISEVLPAILHKSKPVNFFDVGANVGELSLELARSMPNATVFAFEPNPSTYEVLLSNTVEKGIQCFNCGLGDSKKTAKLFSYDENRESGHASMYEDMFEIYGGYGVKEAKNVVKIDIELETVDEVCSQHGVSRIDFLKIDVEGNELNVLKGALEMLGQNAISLIQFEIADCNILSRVFLWDFYRILSNYRFYRLAEKSLIPLGEYRSRNEIFQFQNILAVRDGWMDTLKPELRQQYFP